MAPSKSSKVTDINNISFPNKGSNKSGTKVATAGKNNNKKTENFVFASGTKVEVANKNNNKKICLKFIKKFYRNPQKSHVTIHCIYYDE